jgi:hypothetical protein
LDIKKASKVYFKFQGAKASGIVCLAKASASFGPEADASVSFGGCFL